MRTRFDLLERRFWIVSEHPQAMVIGSVAKTLRDFGFPSIRQDLLLEH